MYTISQIAKLINGKIVGDPKLNIKGVCDLVNSSEQYITFIASKKYEQHFYNSRAIAFIVEKKFNIKRGNKTLIYVEKPSYSIIDVIKLFHPNDNPKEYLHPSSNIGINLKIGSSVNIYPNVTIGNNVIIGNNVTIKAGCSIDNNCVINDNSIINANTTLYNKTIIGKNCIIDAGTVIGSDGFGLVIEKDEIYKTPHIGFVIIEDNVWIGSNCTFDRGTINYTIIGSGTKLDNLIHIAHNVVIGKNCVIAAQVGIAGSTIFENNTLDSYYIITKIDICEKKKYIIYIYDFGERYC